METGLVGHLRGGGLVMDMGMWVLGSSRQMDRGQVSNGFLST